MKDNYQIWIEKYNIAKKNTENAKKNKSVIIEVAAQHPLIDGLYPNEEFRKRLDLAIELYDKFRNNGKVVKIYVPGSIHKYNGINDLVSLSESGKRYLIKNNIDENCIYGEEENIKYKENEGVYNSSDECYVASRIFKDNNFGEIHCVCSSIQLMRKALSYIQFGLIPYMHSVTCDEMFHNYIDEAFINIPILLEDNEGLQGKSAKAEELRKERRPN